MKTDIFSVDQVVVDNIISFLGMKQIHASEAYLVNHHWNHMAVRYMDPGADGQKLLKQACERNNVE